MIGQHQDPPEHGPQEAPTYACTFGTYNQETWTDVRHLSWAELATLLTTHEVGRKEGTCIVPTIFSGTKRAKTDARQIEVVFLDSDAGYTLEEIEAAVSAKGWTGIVSSTHSHLTTTTQVKRGNWDRYRVANEGEEGLPERYMTEVKGYLARVAQHAKITSETDEFTIFEHQPCPKFRVALPLQRPWLATNYDSQKQANAAWKERIEALAAALQLSHDQACTDTSRLFFRPRRPADGPQAETAVLDGQPCDIFGLPRAPPRLHKRAAGKGKAKPKTRRGRDVIEYTDSTTGEVVDLTNWSGRHAPSFQLATALKARRPDLFVPRSGEGVKCHIRCVNDEAHTHRAPTRPRS